MDATVGVKELGLIYMKVLVIDMYCNCLSRVIICKVPGKKVHHNMYMYWTSKRSSEVCGCCLLKLLQGTS